MKVLKFIFLLSLFFFLSCKKNIYRINIENFKSINFEEKINCKIQISRKSNSKILESRIKFRGGYSHGFDKKNFLLNFEKEYEFKGLKKDDDWVLYASVIDKTFLRNVLNYKLFRDFDKRNKSPKTKYVEVYIDNKYYGFYILTERIDISSLNLSREKSLLFKEPYLFRDYEMILDSTAKFSDNYYHQKLPKNALKFSEMDSFKDFILLSSDSVFEAEIFNKIDKKNIIDWHILLMLSNNGDGIVKNFYLYKKNKNRKYRIAIWDCDHSFGRDGDNEYNMLDRLLDIKVNILIKRLMENKNLGYNKSLERRWKKLRDSKKINSSKLKKFIDKESKEIRPFVNKNFQKWPLNGWPYFDDNNVNEEIEIIKKFIDKRIPQLDSLYRY